MFGILMSSVWTAFNWLFRAVVVKAVVFMAFYAVVTLLVAYLASMLPTASTLSGALSGIPSDIWYFLDYMAFSAGAPLVVSAYATRFLIRRMPVIG